MMMPEKADAYIIPPIVANCAISAILPLAKPSWHCESTHGDCITSSTPVDFMEEDRMCGIVGYIGQREAEPILVEGLRRLEYRGYDSAGIATLTGPHLHLRKRAGRIADLAKYLSDKPAPGCHGISHTRWATHGPASDRNAHPHLSHDGTIAVVHNGVIENYSALKRQLQDDGVKFQSDTDTEVIAQLVQQHYDGDLVEAVHKVLSILKGTYGIAVVSTRHPDLLVAPVSAVRSLSASAQTSTSSPAIRAPDG